MPLSESDTRAKLIDPALHQRGWTEDLIRREETAGAIEVIDGRPRRRMRGRVDYTLRVRVNPGTQPVAVALIEAKAEHLPPTHGLEQAKLYAACKRLNVPFVFTSNGHLFVEFDRYTGKTSPSPRPLGEFPSPSDLRARYELGVGVSLTDPDARPLITPYPGGEATRRYYQDAAIRAVLEKIARGEKRALLALATGSGKTFIAVNLLRRIADAGQLRRALFVCDRDELRQQGLGAFHNLFGADAAEVSGSNPQKNARILIATYQTLDVATDDADANFLTTHYPERRPPRLAGHRHARRRAPRDQGKDVRGVKVREVIKLLVEDGWLLHATRGSHRQFRHPTKPGRVTVAGKPADDLAPGTLNSVLKQAQLKGQR